MVFITVKTDIFIQDRGYDGLNPVQFGYQKCEPLHTSDAYPRNHWIYHFVVSGNGIFRFKNNTYHLSENDLFCIPPDEFFFYQADADNPWEYIWICFTSSNKLPVPYVPVIHCPQAASIFISMKNHVKNYSLGQNAYLLSKLWQLMSVLLENDNSYSSYTKQTLAYIYANYNSPDLSVNHIANKNNITRSHLYRIFKNDMGISPSEHLIHLRIEKAKELLAETNTPLADVASLVGYQNVYHFAKIFKQKTGVAPGRYRKYNKAHTKNTCVTD